MTLQGLRDRIAGGESLLVEFKGEERTPLSDRDLVEAVVCLANRASQEPAWLFIGVEDDGRVTGARPRDGALDPVRVQALIANRTRPALACRAERAEVEGRTILVVEIPSARSPVGTTDGRYLRRILSGRGRPECVPYHFHEMQALLAHQGTLDFSALVVPGASWDDLDPLEIERFRRAVRESHGLGDAALVGLTDLEVAKALGAVQANHRVLGVRAAGLLLFGREESLRRHLPGHEAAFQVLSGTQVRVNQFFRWPLLRLQDELVGRLQARNQEEELDVGARRVGVPHYPERAFREAVANALLHRDYTRLGAVHVQLYEDRDRLVISNPGGFPEGVRLDNLLVVSPRPRNPLLADAFKRAGLVERTGRGIDILYAEQLRTGHPPPSYQRSTEVDVVVVLQGGAPDLGFARFVQRGELSLESLLLLYHLRRDGSVTLPEASSLMQRPAEEAREELGRLETLDLALRDAPGRWVLSPHGREAPEAG